MYRDRIAMSLEYGRIYSRATIKFFYIFGIFSILTSVLFIAFAIIETLYWLLYALFLSLPLLVVSICVIARDRNLWKKIDLWLDDTIELIALSTEFDREEVRYMPAIKIKLKFKYNNKVIEKYSGQMGCKGSYFDKGSGYDGRYAPFVDREIKILYSPKYDQVLLLKD